MTRRTLAAIVVLAAASSALAQDRRFGTVTTVQVRRGRSVQAATLGDVDGDGRDDLVIATYRRGKQGGRAIEVHLRRKDGDAFVEEPDLSLDEDEMRTNAVAFAIGDVHEDPGAEIVLFTASGAYAWRPKGPEKSRFVQIVAGQFLWQLADSRGLFAWDAGVRDVDGDGLADIVLPEPDGWRIALQRRGKDGAASFASVSAPRMPFSAADDGVTPLATRKLDARAKRKEVRIAVTFGEDEAEETRDLLVVSESTPAPQFVDWNADGRADLLAQSARELLVWLQRTDGTFPDVPDGEYALPVMADRERRLDVTYGAYVADLDGDRRADCVMLAGDKRAAETRTQVLVYMQGRGRAPADAASPLFGAQGVPAQLLRIGGFAGSPQLVDVDGDGRRDLVLGAIRLDGAIDAARAAASGTVDGQMYVFRNAGGGFSTQPDLTFDVAVKAEGLRKVRSEVLARFFGDVTGDGVRDLFLRDDPERLRVLMTRRSGEGLTIVEPALWETRVAADAKIALRENPRGGPPEILVLENEQVLHVRFP